MKFSTSVEINAPLERVWSLFNNVEDWPRWISSLKKIEKVSEGPLGLALKFVL